VFLHLEFSPSIIIINFSYKHWQLVALVQFVLSLEQVNKTISSHLLCWHFTVLAVNLEFLKGIEIAFSGS